MSSLEFVLELLQIYASILGESLWPVVVILIFFSSVYLINRSLSSFGRKNKVPVSWKHMENMLAQVEQQQLPRTTTSRNSKRRYGLVSQEIQNARNAIAQKDENKLMQSLFTLSMLASHSDQELAQLSEPTSAENPDLVNSEIILPEEQPHR